MTLISPQTAISLLESSKASLRSALGGMDTVLRSNWSVEFQNTRAVAGKAARHLQRIRELAPELLSEVDNDAMAALDDLLPKLKNELNRMHGDLYPEQQGEIFRRLDGSLDDIIAGIHRKYPEGAGATGPGEGVKILRSSERARAAASPTSPERAHEAGA